jgi:hypothetical protein
MPKWVTGSSKVNDGKYNDQKKRKKTKNEKHNGRQSTAYKTTN